MRRLILWSHYGSTSDIYFLDKQDSNLGCNTLHSIWELQHSFLDRSATMVGSEICLRLKQKFSLEIRVQLKKLSEWIATWVDGRMKKWF